MTEKIISLKTRQAFTAPAPAEDAPAVEIEICKKSVIVLEEALRRVKAGETHAIGIIGINKGLPLVLRAANCTFQDLAMLNVAGGMLGDMIAEEINGHIYGRPLEPQDAPEPEPETTA